MIDLHITPREADVLLARIEHGNGKVAARAVGISYQTQKNHAKRLLDRVGAEDLPHAAALLYRMLHEQVVIQHRDGSLTTVRGRYLNGERIHP